MAEHTKPSHGGKRKGAGRKPASEPVVFLKKFRASKLEQVKFKMFMTGDARKDFLYIIRAIECLTLQEIENENKNVR